MSSVLFSYNFVHPRCFCSKLDKLNQPSNEQRFSKNHSVNLVNIKRTESHLIFMADSSIYRDMEQIGKSCEQVEMSKRTYPTLRDTYWK